MNNKGLTTYLNAIPLPMSGLVLALLSCGIFLSSIGVEWGAAIFIIFASIITVVLHVKLLFDFQDCLTQLKNPVILSVFPTFSMSLMLFCVLLRKIPFFYDISYVLWGLAIVVHTVLSVIFIVKYLLQSSVTMANIFPSWFIPFVGFGMITVTAPHFDAFILGQWMLWISFVGYVILLPFILAKILIYRDLPEKIMPLTMILSTPGSLCLAGYLVVIEQKNGWFIGILYVVSQLSYFIAVAHLPKLLKLPFYPSYSAFTFPIVISATVSNSILKMDVFTSKIATILFTGLVHLELALAFVMVIYVSIRYMHFVWDKWKVSRDNKHSNVARIQ